jgi:hypothetical protein
MVSSTNSIRTGVLLLGMLEKVAQIVRFVAVGGLGLNLTSADTLVFMEHDWNPMKDLQVRLLHLVT